MGQLFRKEAGGGSPVLGEVEPPGLFRALPPQGPPSFGCIRLGLALEVRPPSAVSSQGDKHERSSGGSVILWGEILGRRLGRGNPAPGSGGPP